MSEQSEPEAIQILDDLLGGMVMPKNPGRVSEDVPVQESVPTPPPAPPTSVLPPQPATAQQQAAPGTTPPAGSRGAPQVAQMPSVVARASVINGTPAVSSALQLPSNGTFEETFSKLITKDLELAQHDRAMAIALFQTHLDRAEILDQMQLSMPVATVISDNTGATLKSLELAMKAGERVHKAAELLVLAQRNGDAAAIAAMKLKNSNQDSGWGSDLPE